MRLKTIEEANIVKGTRVVLRADFDTAMQKGKILDDFRIRQARDTVRLVIKKGGILRIVSHWGRPEGKRVSPLSLQKLLPSIEHIFEERFMFVKNPFGGDKAKNLTRSSKHILFENIRFWSGEEENSALLAGGIAEWGDCFINEAFAVSHRAHASIVGVPLLMPSFAGYHFEKEISMLSRLLENPKRPFVAILAGEKIETKLALVERFLEKGDAVFIGGTLLNTILAARGVFVGNSPVDKEFIEKPNRVLLTHPKLYLPHDVVVGRSIKSRSRVALLEDIRENETIFDVGPESVRRFSKIIQEAKTVVWNGPLGVAEIKTFAGGTIALAKSIQHIKGFTVVGGGHTVSALHQYGLTEGFTHISTGGGAMLEFLAGKKLPGIEVLLTKKLSQ